MRRSRSLAALASIFLCTGAILPLVAATPAASATPVETAIILNQITPVTVEPGKILRISGRFTTDTELRSVTLQLEVGFYPFVSRSAVTEAAADPPDTTPVSGGADELGLVRANASREFTIAVPAADLPLSTSVAGVYPMRIVATSGPLSAEIDDVSTFLPWVPPDPTVAPTPSRLLFMWPLIDIPRRDAAGDFTVPGLGEEFQPRGRLSTLVESGQRAPVTWVIDPALLADAAALDTGASREWLGSLPSAIGSREVAVVPFGDPDLAAVTAADRLELLRRASARGLDVADAALSPIQVRTDFGWPADGAADPTTIDRARRAGAGLLLLDSTLMPLVTPPVYTPSGRVSQTDPDVELLLADRPASALVASPAAGSDDIVLSRQRFLAETLLHASEAPADARLLVVAPPRRWDPDPKWAEALVQATRKASWLNPVSLDQAVAPDPPVGERSAPVIPEASAERQLPAEMVTAAAEARPEARKFRAILSRPAVLARPIEDAIYTSLSTAWRADHAAAQASQIATIDRLVAQRARVRIVSRGGTLSDDRGLLPITIRNQLDQQVVVRLSATSVDPLRLKVDAPDDKVRVAADGVETVNVQLDAVTSGRLAVDAQILTPNRHAYAAPERLDVDVRAYGNVALIVFGAAAGLMVMAAAVRIGRRIRTHRRGTG